MGVSFTALMSDQNLLDEQLAERVQRGDKNAFNLVGKKYQHKVKQPGPGYVNNPGDVPDVAQEAFIRLTVRCRHSVASAFTPGCIGSP